MAFLKGLTSEEMEVKVLDKDSAPESWPKEWERDFVKHLQSEVRLERFYSSGD